MGIRENIIELRKMYDITQEELAKIADVSRGAVSQWEGGFSEPRMGAIQKIADHFGLYKSNIIEDGGMKDVDPITKKPRHGVMLPSRAKLPADPRPAYAPLYGRVHAGGAQEPEVLDERIPIPYEVRDAHPRGYFLEVEGTCMDRVYPEGCHVYVDPDREPQNGSIAVVSIDGADYVMRRLLRGAHTLVLSPDSYDGKWEDIVVSEGDGHSVSMVGTVVWYQAERELE